MLAWLSTGFMKCHEVKLLLLHPWGHEDTFGAFLYPIISNMGGLLIRQKFNSKQDVVWINKKKESTEDNWKLKEKHKRC